MNRCSKQVKPVPSNDPVLMMEPRYAWWSTPGARAREGQGKMWGGRNGRGGCEELSPAFFHPLCYSVVRRIRSEGVTLYQRRSRTWVLILLCLTVQLYSKLHWIDLIFHNLSQFCPWQGLVSGLPVSVSAYKIFLVIFSPSCLGEGGRWWLGAGHGQSTT